MVLSVGYSLLIIVTMSLITFLLRAAPFVLFDRNKETPKVITYLGNALPPAVMGMLIVYCLKNVSVTDFPFGLPELIAVLGVVMLHLWKKNNLISILGGTALYMILVQMVLV